MVGSGDLKQDDHYSELVMAESQARSRTDSGTHKTVYRALQEQISGKHFFVTQSLLKPVSFCGLKRSMCLC